MIKIITDTEKNVDIWSDAVFKAWDDQLEENIEFWSEFDLSQKEAEEYAHCDHGYLYDSYMWFNYNFDEEVSQDDAIEMRAEGKTDKEIIQQHASDFIYHMTMELPELAGKKRIKNI